MDKQKDPQLHIRRMGKTLRFTCQHCGTRYYSLLRFINGLTWGKMIFYYANKFIPHAERKAETVKKQLILRINAKKRAK